MANAAKTPATSQVSHFGLCCGIADGVSLGVVASPKISAFPMRRDELPVGSGKFLKNGLILVGSGRV